MKSVSICPDLVGNKDCTGSPIGFCDAAAASGSMREILHGSNAPLQDSSSSPNTCFIDMRIKSNKNIQRQKQKRSLQKMKSSRLPHSTQNSRPENFSFKRGSSTAERFEHFPVNYQGSTGSSRPGYQSEEKDGRMSAPDVVLGKSSGMGHMISTDDSMTMSDPSRCNIEQCSPYISPSCSPALKKRLINHQRNSSEWKEHTQDARFIKLDSNASSKSIDCALAKPHFNFHNCSGTSSNEFEFEIRNSPIQGKSGASTPRWFSNASNRDCQMMEYIDGNPPHHSEQVNNLKYSCIHNRNI